MDPVKKYLPVRIMNLIFTSGDPIVTRNCRYPVKGLQDEQLTQIRLEAGDTIPRDRALPLKIAAWNLIWFRRTSGSKTSFCSALTGSGDAPLQA